MAGTWSRHQCAGILERKRCSTWFCLCFVHVAGTWSRHQCAGSKDLAQKPNICTIISEDIDIQFSSIPKPVRRVHKSETLKETTRYQGPKTYLLVQGRATSAREKRNQGLIRWLGRTLESLCKNASAAQCLYDHCFCCHPLMLQIAATKKSTPFSLGVCLSATNLLERWSPKNKYTLAIRL